MICASCCASASAHTLFSPLAVHLLPPFVFSRAISSSHHHQPRAPSLSRVRKGLRASCPSLGRMNACPSWLDGTTDPITRCLPMRLFWTGIQRLSRYPPSRPFSCPNYELPLFFLFLFLFFVPFVSVLFCASGPSLESSGSYEAVHLTFLFTRHGMILTCHVSTPTSSWPVSFDATKCLLADSHPVISFFSACIPPVHGLAQAKVQSRQT